MHPQKRHLIFIVCGIVALIVIAIAGYKILSKGGANNSDDATQEVVNEPPVWSRMVDALLANRILPSMVRIWSTFENPSSDERTDIDPGKVNRRGRWVVVPGGDILTASHLFEQAEEYFVVQLADGIIVPVENLRIYPQDVALVGIDLETTPYERVLNWRKYNSNEEVFTFIEWNIVRWKLLDIGKDQLTTSLPLTPGMSWSPLFSSNGELIWINLAISNQEEGKSYAYYITTPLREAYPNSDGWTRDSEQQWQLIQ